MMDSCKSIFKKRYYQGFFVESVGAGLTFLSGKIASIFVVAFTGVESFAGVESLTGISFFGIFLLFHFIQSICLIVCVEPHTVFYNFDISFGSQVGRVFHVTN